MTETWNAVSVTLFTYVPLRTADGLARLLAALEDTPGMRPTHWGSDERARIPYDRDDLVATVSASRSDAQKPGLRRRQAPAYEATFWARGAGLADVQVEFDPAPPDAQVPAVFALGDALAAALEPELGFVHPIWRRGEESQAYSASGVLSLRDLQRYGLRPACARTWYGPRLVGLIGRERLDGCGALVRDAPWGGVRLDLVDQPWRADFPTLRARQEAVTECLLPSGVYGDYTQLLRRRPGPRWAPFPEDGRKDGGQD